jgi:hypothetical protein
MKSCLIDSAMILASAVRSCIEMTALTGPTLYFEFGEGSSRASNSIVPVLNSRADRISGLIGEMICVAASAAVSCSGPTVPCVSIKTQS